MVALFPPEAGGAAIMDRVALARARLGWPPARDFDPSDTILADLDRLSEMSETLAAALRKPHGAPAQLIADVAREMAARAVRIAQVAAMCGGKP